MTKPRHQAIRRRQQWPYTLNHADTMRAWSRAAVAPPVCEAVYWDAALYIYQQLNTGPIPALRRWLCR